MPKLLDPWLYYIYNRENGEFVKWYRARAGAYRATVGTAAVTFTPSPRYALVYMSQEAAYRRAEALNAIAGRRIFMAVSLARAKELEKMEEVYREMKAREVQDIRRGAPELAGPRGDDGDRRRRGDDRGRDLDERSGERDVIPGRQGRGADDRAAGRLG